MADFQDKDQKTEEATPRKREEARESGQVALSQELVASLMLCAGLASLVLFGGRLAAILGGVLASTLRSLPTLGRDELSVKSASAILAGILEPVALEIALYLLPVLSVGALVAYGQVGFQITPKAVAPKPNKVDPIQGFGRLFSARSAVRTGLALLKLVVITATMVVLAWGQVPGVIRMSGSDLGPVLRAVGHVALRCTAGAVVAIVALSLLDFAFQRFQHERDLRMTKQERKDDDKNTQGDPLVKARIRQVQMAMAQRRMMTDVPDASVVITNPTHYAVALRYDREDAAQPVPTVVAKGVDRLALRIREIAREAGVPRYEDVALARSLYAQVEVGQEIPEDLYAAVATVLAHVYRLQQGRAS